MTYIVIVNADGRLNIENVSMTSEKKEILKKIVGKSISIFDLDNHFAANLFEDFIEECYKENVKEIYSPMYER